MVGAAVTVNVTGTVTEVAPVGQSVTIAVVGTGRQGSGRYAYGHGASSSARGRSVRQPGGVMTDAPAQGPAPGVADGQGLGSGIASPLLGRKGQTGWAHSNGGRYRRCGDGQGHRDVTDAVPVAVSVMVPL